MYKDKVYGILAEGSSSSLPCNSFSSIAPSSFSFEKYPVLVIYRRETGLTALYLINICTCACVLIVYICIFCTLKRNSEYKQCEAPTRFSYFCFSFCSLCQPPSVEKPELCTTVLNGKIFSLSLSLFHVSSEYLCFEHSSACSSFINYYIFTIHLALFLRMYNMYGFHPYTAFNVHKV